MKINIWREFPQYFKPLYPEEQHISVEEEYAQGYEKRYGKNGFMMLVPAPQDLKTGEPNQSAIATINIEKYD